MKTCSACGTQTNLISSLGGVLLCTSNCYPAVEIKVAKLRRSGKKVDVRKIAYQMRQKSL